MTLSEDPTIAVNIPGASHDRNGEAYVEHGNDAGVPSLLVERAKRGDRDAFGEIYRAHHAAIFRFARFASDPGAAEDIVADVFLRAWTALPRYRDTGVPFIAWLYGIARHVAADARRRARRVEPRDALPDSPTDPPSADRVALFEALERLPEEQRQVIELKFLIGCSNDEVGAALGKTPGAVNAQQWRALAQLRRWLEDG